MAESNSVVFGLVQVPFSKRVKSEKLEIIKTGKPCLVLSTLQSSYTEKHREHVRHFQVSLYDKVSWLTGSSHLLTFFVGLACYLIMINVCGILVGLIT